MLHSFFKVAKLLFCEAEAVKYFRIEFLVIDVDIRGFLQGYASLFGPVTFEVAIPSVGL